MYALTIVECDTYQQAQLCRIVFEGEGWPTVAADISQPPDMAFLALTSAPNDGPDRFRETILAYDELGADALAAARAGVKLVRSLVPLKTMVNSTDRDKVREALLYTLYSCADSVVQSDPSRPVFTGITNHDPGDEGDEDIKPTIVADNVAHWENRCIGEDGVERNRTPDEYDGWKSAR